eukprot:1092327-Amphidinium_carterae.1
MGRGGTGKGGKPSYTIGERARVADLLKTNRVVGLTQYKQSGVDVLLRLDAATGSIDRLLVPCGGVIDGSIPLVDLQIYSD